VSKISKVVLVFETAPSDTEHIAAETIGTAVEVHRALGSAFLEGICQMNGGVKRIVV